MFIYYTPISIHKYVEKFVIVRSKISMKSKPSPKMGNYNEVIVLQGEL